MWKSSALTVLVVCTLGIGEIAHAQVISEVMYDLEGTDTGREWVEIFNTTGSSIDLSAYKFFEGNTNHTLTYVQGGATLSSGEYAIITDNAAKFLADWPGFGGVLFDSTFSLSNSGESLVIRNADLADLDSVTYNPALGAAGDGNTLQRTGNGEWQAASPTPGSGSLIVTGESSQSTSEQTETSAPTNTTPASTVPIEPQLYASAGNDRTVLVGADVVFSAKAFSKDGTPLDNSSIRYIWNFGDGITESQQTIAHHFSYPGTYVVVLDVASGKNDASDRIIVTAVDPELHSARLDDGRVVITNNSAREIDLSFWHVQRGDSFFTIPDHTAVLAKKQLILRPDAVKLPPGDVVLLYPNGMKVPIVDISIPTKASVAASQSFMQTPARQTYVPEIVEDTEVNVVPELSDVSSNAEANLAAASVAGSGVYWFIGLAGLLLIGGGGIALLFKQRDPIEGWDIQEGGKHPDD